MKTQSEIIVGIDPGFATLGYAFIEKKKNHIRPIDFGVITTSSLPFVDRLQIIIKDLLSLFDEYHPSLLCIEKIFWGTNTTNAIRVAEVRGAVLLKALEYGMDIREVAPNEVKSALVGYGKASKEQIQKFLMHRFGFSTLPTPDDAADALAIGIYAAEHTRLILE
jgi:crossover junction endodeoxyribonuclease RuvC